MDSIPKKLYNIHRFDARSKLELYFSDKEDMIFGEDSLKFPMMNLHYVFSRGFICGNLLIDLSMGAFIHHLYSAANIFKDIIIIQFKFNEKCTMEVRRWHGDRTGAFSWTHTKTAFEELEGKSDQNQDKELNLKASIKHIVTCNLEEENLTHPLVLPLADCVISEVLLDVISKDEDDYMRNLEKISNLLKIGGHLILFGLLNTTYITAGADRFHMMKYDESFVRSSLSKLGFVIDYCAVQRRRNVSDLIDYSHIYFITAHKEK
ncbi:PREDICTED: nicotinamide N-methyltransferase-like [Nanorana parkeri]|uniref:nicotinamide N-methyltransferase-like n=1 Tax=Nanorana parkeri TaxID=125878 RepID=UPI0008547C03|nr:PREDICTED: nicotinamide N-methyltransferase-like [Nanorana parkeri]